MIPGLNNLSIINLLRVLIKKYIFSSMTNYFKNLLEKHYLSIYLNYLKASTESNSGASSNL